MNQNESLKTAFGYIRVSTHMQEEISPEAQKHELQKWAKQHNILITQWFQDNGISGKKAENRTAFQNMIALAKEKDHPDYILAWKFSRFARNHCLQIAPQKKQCAGSINQRAFAGWTICTLN